MGIMQVWEQSNEPHIAAVHVLENDVVFRGFSEPRRTGGGTFSSRWKRRGTVSDPQVVFKRAARCGGPVPRPGTGSNGLSVMSHEVELQLHENLGGLESEVVFQAQGGQTTPRIHSR
jgi:hypothetical protein